MKEIFKKIFAKRIGAGRLIASGISLFLGFIIVFAVAGFYLQMSDFLSSSDANQNYIILNKKVNLLNTITGSGDYFSDDELAELEDKPYVEDVGRFIPNLFEMNLYVFGDANIKTDLFFEAVPDRFLDVKPFKWKWREGDDFVPIIMSRDFLNLYNFGYAMSSGKPQFSEGTAKMLPLKLEIKTNQRPRPAFNAKIVAFSDRIPSVLVPESFMNWSNSKYAVTRREGPSRVMLKLSKGKKDAFENFVEESDYQVNEETMKSQKIAGYIVLALQIFMILGLVFIGFSIMTVITNNLLLIQRSHREIQLLIQLGYARKTLIQFFSKGIILFLVPVFAISYAIWYVFSVFLMPMIPLAGLEVQVIKWLPVLGLGLLIVLVLYLALTFSVKKAIRRI